jgi:uncharacterized membrane protein YcaP (DUF421 family)
MLISFVRTLILYGLVVLVTRVMGKRQISQLQPFELVVAIMLSELATIPMQNTSVPLVSGIIPIFTLMIIQITFSYLSLKSEKARKIICGSPSILIENGKIVEEELTKLRLSLSDLMEILRIKDYYNIDDIEFAILETSGEISVIPKAPKRPLTPEDLNLPTPNEGLPYTMIMDGKIDYEGLVKSNHSLAWLQKELKKRGVKDPREVFFAFVDTTGKLYLQLRNADKEKGGTSK